MTDGSSLCALEKLPLELLLRISDSLTTPELSNFRLTSKSIEDKLFHSFAIEFFSQKQFMLSLFSLQALVDISKSRLSPFLQRLQFSLRCPEEAYSCVQNLHPSIVGAMNMALLDALDHEKHAWAMGIQRDLLIEAFRNLKELREIVLRTFDSRGRHRDGQGAAWKSYGWRRLTDLQGDGSHRWNYMSSESHIFGTSFYEVAVSVLLIALGKADARPRAIENLLRPSHNSVISDASYSIPPQVEASVFPVLHGLEKLHIALSNHSGADGSYNALEGRCLAAFLRQTTNLKDLRLNVVGSYPYLIKCLAKPINGSDGDNAPSDMTEPFGIALPKLEALSLGCWRIRAQEALAMIEKFAPTLKSLELWRMTFSRSPYNDPSAEAEYRAEGKSTCWTGFFERLVEIKDLELEHLKVSLMSQYTSTVHGRDQFVCFQGDDEESKTRSITGKAWKSFVLRDMLPVHAIAPPRAPSPSPMHSSEEDMLGQEEEEPEESDHDGESEAS